MRNKKTVLYFALLIGILTTTQIISGSAWKARPFPWSDQLNDVQRIFQGELSFDFFDEPSVDIDTISSSPTFLQIELSLSTTPVIDTDHGYRIIIGWTTEINGSYICDWENYMHWEETIRPLANYTVCVAGGISMFGVTNGSLTVLNNSVNDPTFYELQNNTVTIDDKSLIFQVNHTAVADPVNPVGALIVTTYNVTTYNATSATFETITYADSLSSYYLGGIFGHHVQDTGMNIIVVISMSSLACLIQAILIKRRK
ncbi:MAG: hypothetical protein JXA54_10640 [Candidatus Heimdallarchaeota archaeon]|nr:hypothetical protein [Candidatus Heimdallarchaeota archaeon]